MNIVNMRAKLVTFEVRSTIETICMFLLSCVFREKLPVKKTKKNLVRL